MGMLCLIIYEFLVTISMLNVRQTFKVDARTKNQLTPCSPGDDGAMEMNWMKVESDQLKEPELTIKDFERAIKVSRPTVNAADILEHTKFTNDFGQEG
jgi:vacuolar protein-sorting-associated protein 4